MIRTYQGTDMEEVIRIHNMAMPHHAMDEKCFVKNILLDLNFDEKGFFIAEENGETLGFIQVILRKIPVEPYCPMDEDKAFINLIGLKYPRDVLGGLGSMLLKKAEEYVSSFGPRRLLMNDYTPNYIYQGMREDYADYLKLFEASGYQFHHVNQSISVDLLGFSGIPGAAELKKQREAEGYLFTPLKPCYIPALLHFENRSWVHRYRRLLLETMDYEKILLVLFEGKVAGCVVFGDPYSCEERFGPFAVDSSFRGKGLGKILLDDCLWAMKKRGLDCAWAQSTPINTPADYLYQKAGFRPTGKYAHFFKDISI